jgi:hypothetical protein
MGSPDSSSRAARSSPIHWYLAALLPIWIGYFMYKTEASEQQRLRLLDPVAAVGEFVKAECIRPRKRSFQDYWLATTYAFVAAGYVSYEEHATPDRGPRRRSRRWIGSCFRHRPNAKRHWRACGRRKRRTRSGSRETSRIRRRRRWKSRTARAFCGWRSWQYRCFWSARSCTGAVGPVRRAAAHDVRSARSTPLEAGDDH